MNACIIKVISASHHRSQNTHRSSESSSGESALSTVNQPCRHGHLPLVSQPMSNTQAAHASGLVFLHISTHVVSLEFARSCFLSIFFVWPDAVGLKRSRRKLSTHAHRSQHRQHTATDKSHREKKTTSFVYSTASQCPFKSCRGHLTYNLALFIMHVLFSSAKKPAQHASKIVKARGMVGQVPYRTNLETQPTAVDKSQVCWLENP